MAGYGAGYGAGYRIRYNTGQGAGGIGLELGMGRARQEAGHDTSNRTDAGDGAEHNGGDGHKARYEAEHRGWA